MNADDLLARLDSRLSPAEKRVLATLISLAREQNVALYLVGGAVRDLLLDRAGFDLDLAVEGPVDPLARELASALDTRVVAHEQFGTATVRGPGFEFDLAQTRRETYARPGALPTVELIANIDEDLARRDFTINALALRLTEPASELIDPHGGHKDLYARLICVLHKQSFRDDATRMLRAVRYAARLNFALTDETAATAQRDLSYVKTISGARLRRELALTFEESVAPQAIRLANELGILRAIHRRLSVEAHVLAAWRDALGGEHRAPADELGFCLIASTATLDDVASLSARLQLAGRYERALTDFVRLRDASDKLTPDDPVSVVDMLDGQAPAAVWAVSLLDDGRAAQAAKNYLDRWRHVRPQLSGDDLIAMGATPGPTLGAILRDLRNARLEGRIQNRDDELTLARRLVEENRQQ